MTVLSVGKVHLRILGRSCGIESDGIREQTAVISETLGSARCGEITRSALNHAGVWKALFEPALGVDANGRGLAIDHAIVDRLDGAETEYSAQWIGL